MLTFSSPWDLDIPWDKGRIIRILLGHSGHMPQLWTCAGIRGEFCALWTLRRKYPSISNPVSDFRAHFSKQLQSSTLHTFNHLKIKVRTSRLTCSICPLLTTYFEKDTSFFLLPSSPSRRFSFGISSTVSGVRLTVSVSHRHCPLVLRDRPQVPIGFLFRIVLDRLLRC